jgi:hypothetical protein
MHVNTQLRSTTLGDSVRHVTFFNIQRYIILIKYFSGEKKTKIDEEGKFKSPIKELLDRL